MEQKIQAIQKRVDELERLLQSQAVINDVKKLPEYSREYKELQAVMENYQALNKIEQELAEAQNLLKGETDHELKRIYEEEIISQIIGQKLRY